jgi:uncharacterized membrane protein YhhN
MSVARMVLLVIFGSLSVLNLVAVALKMRKVQYFSTPLRVPCLAVFYILGSTGPSWLVIAALAFAFIGDIIWFLQKKEAFMMLMSGAYLLCLVFYAIALVQPISQLRDVPAWHYAVALVYVAYFMLVYTMLKSYMGEMKGPMTVYLAVVMVMGFAALTRLWRYQGLAFWFPFAGSLSFIASETVHGFHMFKHRGESKHGELFGDLFYISAQALLVLGFTRW